MTPQTLEEQLTKYLTDAHSIEEQALIQLKLAPRLAGDQQIAQAFSAHLTETEEHERLVRERLAALDARPAKLKDLAGTITGTGFAAFAAAQPDTPAKLCAFAYAFEHLEIGAYELLARVAQRAGDQETVRVAEQILAEERAAAAKLEALLPEALEASLQAQELRAR